MALSAQRSLKHEYDLYVENEIDAYKESISRTALLKIGDEAVASLQSSPQFTLSELLLVDEVDKIIRKRLRIPSYQTWRKQELKRRKELEEFVRPEHWGLSPESPVAKEIRASRYTRVLVAGEATKTALYLAANGCAVTALDGAPSGKSQTSAVDESKVPDLPGTIDHHKERLHEWLPSDSFTAVVCTPDAFAGLTARQRAHAIAVLQSATEDGGVHLVETIVAGGKGMSLAELQKSYKGWEVSVVEDGGSGKSFLARKAVA